MIDAVSFSPFLPWWSLGFFAVLGAIIALLRVKSSPLGALLRLLTILLIVGFLSGPQRQDIDAVIMPDIVAVFEDQSRSLEFGDRDAEAKLIREQIVSRLEAQNLEVRTIPFGDGNQTNLTAAMRSGLADVPRSRLSAAIIISDGQLHNSDVLPINVPVHGFIVGDSATQRDRRVEIIRAPRFGIVGETIEITLRVEALGESGTVPTTLYVGGEIYAQQALTIGEDVTISVPLKQPGETIIELAVAVAPNELTTLNNRAVTALSAVRDRLRILLISGEPHAGERVWRNTLKSDPAVDLVHFTILKPGNKSSVAPRDELNLIEFPHQELFLDKLPEFDILIFDRYTYRGVLQSFEFEEIANYVKSGGAVLISSGPEMSERSSLAARPNLAYLLPILPSGPAVNAPFVPTLSVSGARHPITNTLEDSNNWGRWLRYIPGTVKNGETLLTTPDGSPLLVVGRAGEGRIGVLMSDHVWLWARGVDGGGPYQELLRRLVHWLMQEPELEEESLTGQFNANDILTINRQSLTDDVAEVTITFPDGTARNIELSAQDAGSFQASLPTDIPGLYRLTTQTAEGRTLYALATSGQSQTQELEAVHSTEAILRDLITPPSGIWTLRDAAATLPEFRRIRADAKMTNQALAGLPRRDVRDIVNLSVAPLLPAWVWVIIIAGCALLAWLVESGARGKSTQPQQRE